MKLLIDVYECSKCHTIFAVEKTAPCNSGDNDITCPDVTCKSDDIRCVGDGDMEVSEH